MIVSGVSVSMQPTLKQIRVNGVKIFWEWP